MFCDESYCFELVGTGWRGSWKIFCDEVNAKHNAVLGLATGASPIPTYEYMTEQYRTRVSFKDVRTFNLDEYCDLPKNHLTASIRLWKRTLLEGRYKARKCQFP